MNVIVTVMFSMLAIAWPVFSGPAAATPAFAAPADTKADLKEKFEGRYPKLQQAKRQGKVGETWQGYVESVEDDSDEALADLMKDENADRKKLYALIAEEETKGDRKVSLTQVAERNARRNFGNAKPSEPLKTRDNKWIQRKDVEALKKKGVIGETWEGYVEVVDDADAQQKAVVAEVNRIRKDEYVMTAKKRDTTAERIAQQAGRKAMDDAAAGEFIKDKGGKWMKKKA